MENNNLQKGITFDELVRHGLENGANVNNGMPWSWKYNEVTITHENDECYLICNPGEQSQRFTPKDILMVSENRLDVLSHSE